MQKVRSILNKILDVLAGSSMAVMVILTTYQVITRYIFKSPSTWSDGVPCSVPLSFPASAAT